jgi:hypothetical protein
MYRRNNLSEIVPLRCPARSGTYLFSCEDTSHSPETSETISCLVQEPERKRQKAQDLLHISKNRVYKKWRGFKSEQILKLLVKHSPDLQFDDYFRRTDSGQSSLSELRSAPNSLLLHQFNLDELKDDWTAFLTHIQSRTQFGSEARLP